MNTCEKYNKFALCREMLETPGVIRQFQLKNADKVTEAIKAAGKLFLTGEGSSRIYPAKNAMRYSKANGIDIEIATDGSRQASEYDLTKYVVCGASNSGQTKELICLFNDLKAAGHNNLFGITANKDTKLESIANQAFVLSCGKEDAVAATKSVEEQALCYTSILFAIQGKDLAAQLSALADGVQNALTIEIPEDITKAIANAGTIYFAGRNDGVAEELTLKTNEITRKKSDYLEGTYALHGIEEVMNANDVVIWIDPFEEEYEKIQQTLVDGVGMKVIAVSNKETVFPTIKVNYDGPLATYVYLAAGWNILVEVGISLGINLDKPVRARKVGNEFIE